jgi:hypothetical protein
LRTGKFQIFAAFLVFAGGAVFAGRPLAIDDADPVEQGQFEFELGSVYEHDPVCDAWEFPFGLTAGILPNVEAGAGFGGVVEERTELGERDHESGIGDLTVGTKWQFLKETGWLPRQALAAAVKFPTADDDKGLGSGKTDYDLTWIASKKLSEKTGLHVNVGYTWVGAPSGGDVGDVFHYGVALDYQLTDSVQWVGEVFAEKELQDGTQTVVQYNSGFRWSAAESLVLDVAAGSRLRGDEAPDFAVTLGLTWTFGRNKNNES